MMISPSPSPSQSPSPSSSTDSLSTLSDASSSCAIPPLSLKPTTSTTPTWWYTLVRRSCVAVPHWLTSLSSILHHHSPPSTFVTTCRSLPSLPPVRQVVVAFAPVVLWLLLFSSGVHSIPPRARPTINTTILPAIDAAMGYSFRWFDTSIPLLRPVLDLLAAVPYTIHPILPLLYIALTLLTTYVLQPHTQYHHHHHHHHHHQHGVQCPECTDSPAAKPRILTFVFVFGCMNVAAVLTHLVFPTSPPWYFESYGTHPASYTMKGQPAVLARVDALLHISFFYRMYHDGGKIVFGSWPSLHAAWPYLMVIFRPSSPFRTVRVALVLYTCWVWWAAMYLHHHYLIDLVGGALYAHAAYYFASSRESRNADWMGRNDKEPLLPISVVHKQPQA